MYDPFYHNLSLWMEAVAVTTKISFIFCKLDLIDTHIAMVDERMAVIFKELSIYLSLVCREIIAVNRFGNK
jgi:hypothetical protein